MGVTYKGFNLHNIAPKQATYIAVYNSNGEKVDSIKLGDFKPATSEPLYKFGLLSDVHNQKSSTTQDDNDFQNAIKVFNNDHPVSFICICGDITQNASETQLSYYRSNIELSNIPIYTTTGNHDCPYSGKFNETMWKEYTGCDKLMIFNSNNIVENTDDVFIFFGMNNYSLGSSGSPYLDEDILWLEQQLEENRNKRVFIFTHLFFPDKAGNFNNIYPLGNWLGGSQLDKLTKLNEKYLNTIWFSGHSHWMWDLQKFPDFINETENADRANVFRSFDEGGNSTSGWAAHVPSCASPIDSHGTDRWETGGPYSEGAIVEVYEDYIILKGVSFKGRNDEDYNFKYVPLAQYKLNTDLIHIEETVKEIVTSDYITPADCTENLSPGKYSGASVEQCEDGYIRFTFTRTSQSFYISPSVYDSTKICKLIVEDIIYENPMEWDESMINTCGFYKKGGGYTVSSGDIVDAGTNGVQFNSSSSYSGDFDIVIKIKFKLQFE